MEIIRIENAPAGRYMLAIIASNILRPPQDVAVVVTGRLKSALTGLA